MWRGVPVRLLAVAVGVMWLPLVSGAQTSPAPVPPLLVTLQQFKYLGPSQAAEVLLEAGAVRPGDVIEYRASYHNRGSEPLAVTARLPIPLSVVYEASSASASQSLQPTVAQADQRFAPEPLEKTVVRSGSEPVVVKVPYADYRYVQWNLGRLQPGITKEVRLRARVAQTQPLAPSAATPQTPESVP